MAAPLKKADLLAVAQYLIVHLSYNQTPQLAKRHKLEVEKNGSPEQQLLKRISTDAAFSDIFSEDDQRLGLSIANTLRDLRGKHISLGQPASGTVADARVVLAAAGLTEKDITAEYLRPGVAANNVKDGTLDGFFIIGGVPVPAVRDLAAETPVRLIPVDDDVLAKMRESSTSYRRSVIPSGTYPGISLETPSIGFDALWIVSADAPDDLIYAITKALWNEATQRLLDARDPLGKQVRLEGALDGLSIPLHPGAKRFYREAGLPVDQTGVLGKRENPEGGDELRKHE